jgi:hypothetical protein
VKHTLKDGRQQEIRTKRMHMRGSFMSEVRAAEKSVARQPVHEFLFSLLATV